MTANVMMEQEKCPICTKDHDSGAILLRKRLLKPENESHERNLVTGWGICPDCKGKNSKGFYPLVVIDPNRSEKLPNGNMKLEGAYRTGEIVFIRKEVASKVLNTELVTSFAFIDEVGADRIKNMVEK